MHTSDPAARRLGAARPLLVDVLPARDVVPHLAAGGISHAGPPILSTAMCPPMRRAVGVAAAIEGIAATPEAALERVDRGDVPLRTNHDLGGVGPMSGIVTGSMPLLVARDEETGRTAWCPLNEGSGAVLRYGADGPEVVRRLEWMRDVLGPALSAALAAHGPLDLIALQEASLAQGDECHHRTEAGTALVAEALGPHLPAEVTAFVVGNGQFFLNLAMVSAKLATVCAEGVPGSALLTAIARNGVEVGIRLSGTGDAWFVGPAALPDPARLYAGRVPGDMNPDLGDSAIVEVYGLGALAIAGSPLSAPSVGLDAREIDAIDARLRGIAAADHPLLRLRRTDGTSAPAILGVDARAVVELGIRPPVHTGIAHRLPGVGQIGGGVTHPPENAFHEAIAALDATVAAVAG